MRNVLKVIYWKFQVDIFFLLEVIYKFHLWEGEKRLTQAGRGWLDLDMFDYSSGIHVRRSTTAL